MSLQYNLFLRNDLKDSILKCFGSKIPNSIILGGSYTNSEGNIYSDESLEYYLSDIDLVCINDSGFSLEESQNIYKNMLLLSKSINQRNPYFHIGLKLRSSFQLEHEANSLYFKELSESSFPIHGNDFLSYFHKKQNFGFFNLNFEKKNKILYQCALTRLWCNVLFFPLKLLRGENREYRIWYNYFFSRGALDYITWSLIRNDLWESGYQNRFHIWSKSKYNSRKYSFKLEKCLNTKIGKSNTDYREIIKDILDFSIDEISQINSNFFNKNGYELDFLISMNRFIEAHSLKKSNENIINHLSNASKQLSRIASKNCVFSSNLSDIEQWNSLRKIYSNFRFNRNAQDKIDHNIYTEHFLKIGS